MMGTRLAIAGATGVVGGEILKIIEQQRPALAGLGLFASEHSAGEEITVLGQPRRVEALSRCDFTQYDAALFCIGDELSREYVPRALAAGCRVVDKSNCFRLDAQVPLLVPGVNDAACQPGAMLAANPNCTTIVLVHALAPLKERFGLQRVFAATYQSLSGAGKDAALKLRSETEVALAQSAGYYLGLPASSSAFNVQPRIGGLNAQGQASEEAKLVVETRKILSLPELPVISHAVRVPVFVGHAIAVTVELEQPASAEAIRAAWQAAPDVRVLDGGQEPTPAGASTHDQVEAGRLRAEPGVPNGWSFFACGDNLRIGAALNGWRILELIQRTGGASVGKAG
jgi:aspartate-semialdehyde dehydrogenase